MEEHRILVKKDYLPSPEREKVAAKRSDEGLVVAAKYSTIAAKKPPSFPHPSCDA